MAVINIKSLTDEKPRFVGGHRLCAGCNEGTIVRQVLLAAHEYDVVAFNATGCLEVTTSVYPYSSWGVPWLHEAFENTAAAASGAEAAYKALKRFGDIPEDKKIKFIAFAGDGGTYDIGLQALSGAMERGHSFLYVMLDNEAYMNTGIQRSSSTPEFAWTTTSPVGAAKVGKAQPKKNIVEIVAAHGIPYVATASPSHYVDLMTKVQKALSYEGPTFLAVYSNCNRGHRNDTGDSIKVSRMAVETNYWPLYEIENGKYHITFKPRNPKPIEDWLKLQGRFAHLMKSGNEDKVAELQQWVNSKWELLQKKEEFSNSL
ncbi:thiamine pyrophosphate-dependent enzyme [Coprothermobacter platensis]|uniref:thiamine pyrophosphate-dependent enzyme n=1 Tax=Coprothermobacter platensis TaxID=108819 RepID=UPI000380EEBE|nr:thiamine pyrophosphate-dependent enzyme [Coprothermobacter platensis]